MLTSILRSAFLRRPLQTCSCTPTHSCVLSLSGNRNALVLTALANFRVFASLDRKRLGQAMFWKARNTLEAFSIRRLGGSRWRLRRTRCAMGFDRQPGSEQSLGRAMRPGGNAIGMVGVATEMSKSARGKLLERQWRSIGHTRASACRSTSSGR